jgi:hypothetical protein
MPSEKAVSRGMIEFEYRKNQLTVFLTEVRHPATHGFVDCTGTNAGRFANCSLIIKLCRNSGVDILWFGMFPVEKANDYSLLELHEKWLNSKCTWLSLENAIILIKRQGGQIRTSGTEANPRQ